MEVFNSELVYKTACIVSAVICAGMGLFLYRVFGLLKDMRSIFPEDLIPYHYISVRRALGFAYIFIGLTTLVRIWIHVPEHTDILFPGIGLVISASQIIIATSALLSLYNSRMVNRCTVWGNVLIFVVLASVYALCWNNPMMKEIVRYTWFAVYVLQMLVFTVVFFVERRRYLTIMTARLGVDAKEYSKPGVVVLFVLSLLIAIWSSTSLFFPSLGFVSLFILFYTLYYVALGLYFQTQWEDSPVVQEIISEENESYK